MKEWLFLCSYLLALYTICDQYRKQQKLREKKALQSLWIFAEMQKFSLQMP